MRTTPYLTLLLSTLLVAYGDQPGPVVCLYRGIGAFDLLTGKRPESSVVGIGISAAALLVMPSLVVKKRRNAGRDRTCRLMH